MNSANLLDRVLSKVVKKGTLMVTHADGHASTFGEPTDGFPDIKIRLMDTKVARDIMLDPRLGAGESFMDGRLVIKSGDVMGLTQLLRANKPWERGGSLLKPSPIRRIMGRFSAARESINRQKSARANVAHHYDIGNELYGLMLDSEHMQYSCGYWAPGTKTLVEAQTAKLAHIAAKLALRPGQQVLDIGCGWGGMAIYLARNFDVNVTGITLSEEQLALARTRTEQANVSDRVKFELIDYRDMAARGDQFDRIVSVGMFEHVGPPQFETFFSAVTQLLGPDGVMLLHTIGRMGSPGSTDAFTRKFIFPGGYIPALSETMAASEKFRLIATDIETLRLHYAKTLRAWYANCIANQTEIEALHDKRFFRLWIFYLAGATAAFESGGLCNYQIQYARNRKTLPITRDYMAEAERNLKSDSS